MSFVNGFTPSPKIINNDATPPVLILNPDYETWFRKDQILLSWLLSSLTKKVFPYIIGLDSSQAVWSSLANSFSSISQN